MSVKGGFYMDAYFNTIVNDIREAMEKQELKAYYQPQYDALSNKLLSAEALVRWVREDGSVVPPVAFIPALEQNSTINEVDWYMLEEVCRFLQRSHRLGMLTVPIHVNFSRWHIKEEGFHQKLDSIVKLYDLKPEEIVVEITESAVAAESDLVAPWVEQIRNMGYSVALDDFGCGLSSLQFIKDISFDILKIDKGLLSDNCRQDKARIVLESIFYFANRLKMLTVAEGVETEEQLGFLRTCDCKRIQGFLYSKPLPEAEYLLKLTEQKPIDFDYDILSIQTLASTTNLLMDVLFRKFPLIIITNLTRNSYYMVVYDSFSQTSCPASGKFDELIVHGASSMHPEDQEAFATTFQRERLLKMHEEGSKEVRLVTRQIGNDGEYRKVETVDYFVESPGVDDVIVITLCQNIE